MSQTDELNETYKVDQQKKSVPVTINQIEALKTCIDEAIISYKQKRRRNKIGAIFVQLITTILTTVTTILLGWQLAELDDSSTIKLKRGIVNLALILSAATTGISTLNSYFDYKALWIAYNVALLGLESVRSRLAYLKSIGAEHLEQIQLEELYKDYNNIRSLIQKDYKDIRSSND